MKTVIVAAITADGFIGRTSDHLADWTGKADKKLFVQVTKEAGAMVMGSRTFATIGGPLYTPVSPRLLPPMALRPPPRRRPNSLRA
jgi:dihydrofolate reductase